MAETLAPVTLDRVSQVLKASGLEPTSGSGGVTISLEGSTVVFRVVEEDHKLLQVLGLTKDVQEGNHYVDSWIWFANSWNVDTLWPKAIVLFQGEAPTRTIQLRGEHTLVYAGGATDTQLDVDISTAVDAMKELFIRYSRETTDGSGM